MYQLADISVFESLMGDSCCSSNSVFNVEATRELPKSQDRLGQEVWSNLLTAGGSYAGALMGSVPGSPILGGPILALAGGLPGLASAFKFGPFSDDGYARDIGHRAKRFWRSVPRTLLGGLGGGLAGGALGGLVGGIPGVNIGSVLGMLVGGTTGRRASYDKFDKQNADYWRRLLDQADAEVNANPGLQEALSKVGFMESLESYRQLKEDYRRMKLDDEQFDKLLSRLVHDGDLYWSKDYGIRDVPTYSDEDKLDRFYNLDEDPDESVVQFLKSLGSIPSRLPKGKSAPSLAGA